jgi:plasmid stabilization system protein ParE
MGQVTLSPKFTKQLDEICAHIARSSQQSAEEFGEKALELVQSFPAQPRLGPVVPEYNDRGLRERLYKNHRILYRLRGDDVEVVAIFHGSRRLPRTPPG